MLRENINKKGLPKWLAKYLTDVHKWASEDRKLRNLVTLEDICIRDLENLLYELKGAVENKQCKKHIKVLFNKITIALCSIYYFRLKIHQEFLSKGKPK